MGKEEQEFSRSTEVVIEELFSEYVLKLSCKDIPSILQNKISCKVENFFMY